MRMVVMSDSHGVYNRVSDIVKKHHEADLIVHLGDGEEEFLQVASLYPAGHFIGVRGNNDFYAQSKKVERIRFGGVPILMTHGHIFGVKFSLNGLLEEALKQNVRVALYGHTHEAKQTYREGIYLLNPGSVADSRLTPTGYMLLDVTDQGIVPVFCTI